jgi:hypothetical protein
MPVRRLAAAVLLVSSFSGVAVAKDPFPLLPSEPVANWTAPPYWMPSAAALPEKATKGSPEAELSPDAVEAVPTAPLAFTSITPCRVADTRGNGFSGQYGPPQLTPVGRDITIINTCGIPAAAQAVSFNFSAVNVPAAGFLVAYPAGGAFPPVATMTYNQNTPNLSNAAVVPLGTGGAITVVAAVVAIDLVIDVNGYYAPQTVVNTVNGLSGAVTLAQGSNITITPSGQTLTIASTGGGASGWSLIGNAGTTPGTNFLGTTDNQALELKVNGQRVLRIEPAAFGPNVVAGFSGNAAANATSGAVIAGGGLTGFENIVSNNYGTVGGGYGNHAGIGEPGSALGPTISGGISNTATHHYSAVGGGHENLAGAPYASVGGGASNIASGYFSTVPGGALNVAQGSNAFAAGWRAKANHAGTFVWGDNSNADVASTNPNQFIVRASGGIWLGTTSSPNIPVADFLSTSTGAHLTTTGIWSNNSDRESKENFEPLNARDLLARLQALPITTWNYKLDGSSVRHLGPTAQDFAVQFGLGSDDHSIGTLDADGVALAAIQALYGEVQELRRRLAALEAAED